MKTTLEIPDAVFRRAKALAAEQGIPLRQLVIDAVEDRLRAGPGNSKKPWLKFAGKLRHLRKETARINRLIDRECEQIEPGIGLDFRPVGLRRRRAGGLTARDSR